MKGSRETEWALERHWGLEVSQRRRAGVLKADGRIGREGTVGHAGVERSQSSQQVPKEATGPRIHVVGRGTLPPSPWKERKRAVLVLTAARSWLLSVGKGREWWEDLRFHILSRPHASSVILAL